MKIKWLLPVLTCLIVSVGNARVLKQFAFQDCTIELLDSTGAAEVSGKSDEYSKALTTFDLQIRLGRTANVSERDYLNRAASQALSWDNDDQIKLLQSFEQIASFLKEQNVKLRLPEKIQLIKTAGQEEFGAEGYTRGNSISLCIKPGQEISTHIVAHELFHVFSRFNPQIRDKVYAVFGFEKCNRMNTAAAMNNRVITNPDCPFIEYFIPLTISGKSRDYVLQLYSVKPFEGHFGLENANVALLEVEGGKMDKKPKMKAGEGLLLQLDAVPEIFEKISQNTPYILHPEEISAEHFAMWVIQKEVPQPEYFSRIKEVLIAE